VNTFQFNLCLLIGLLAKKGAERDQLDKIYAKHNEVPGPGYYNTISDFDAIAASSGHGDSTDFLVRLNNAKKRQHAVFESKTDRNSILGDVFKRAEEPGRKALLHLINLSAAKKYCPLTSLSAL
jgi:hypothetical protein